LSSSSSNTPLFDKIEFRTQTNEFELNKQRYSVRLYPKGFGATKAGKQVYNATMESGKVEHVMLLHRALKKRYLLVIGLLHAVKILKLNKELIVVHEDRVTVLEKSRNNINFDINDLVVAEDDYTNLQLELIGLESSMSGIMDSIRIYMPTEGPVEFNTVNLADIELIEKNTRKPVFTIDPDNIYLKGGNLRLKLAKDRYALEKAENRKYINFLEVSFDNDESRDAAKAYSLQLAINLPFVNSRRLDINRRKLKFLTAKGRYEELKISLTENLRILSGDMERLFKQYRVLIKRKETGSAESSLKRYIQLEGGDPLVLLVMRESILKNDIQLETIWYEIYTKYIELLDIVGKLSEMPLKNFISTSLEFSEQ
ncbi:MAG: hypothetical protein ACUZ8H_11875, partial [Candidatus Anammoxibacter sp.]